MLLEDKVAIVTGASQGIGRAIAGRYVREGARVVLADIKEEEGKAAAGELGDAARFVACDVGDGGQVEALVQAAVDAFGRIDIMVANAGIVHAAEFLELDEADFDRVLRVNLKGAFLCGQAAARQMVKQGGGGAIVNLSSVNAVLAIPNQVPYNVSKGGVNQLTHVAALALAPHGIRVNAIGPGSIGTDMLQSVLASDPKAREKVMARTPMGRLGDPEEMASVAVFLASEMSSYITGQVIYADGGRLPLNYTVPVEE